MIKPKRYLEYDRKRKVYRMRWLVESTCAACGRELEDVFEKPPEKGEILFALTMPCSRCFKVLEKECFQKPKSRAKAQKSSGARKKCIRFLNQEE